MSEVNGLFVVQAEVISKVIADLTDKIKDHPLDVKSLEYTSKLTIIPGYITVQESSHQICYLSLATASEIRFSSSVFFVTLL